MFLPKIKLPLLSPPFKISLFIPSKYWGRVHVGVAFGKGHE
ncbi:MAG: hypothetical protein NZ736_05910 [Candidatus Poseidoniaceae archaeon]|nr:hypothetical protein [Candidatus Poseidoniaceae archaeon]